MPPFHVQHRGAWRADRGGDVANPAARNAGLAAYDRMHQLRGHRLGRGNGFESLTMMRLVLVCFICITVGFATWDVVTIFRRNDAPSPAPTSSITKPTAMAAIATARERDRLQKTAGSAAAAAPPRHYPPEQAGPVSEICTVHQLISNLEGMPLGAVDLYIFVEMGGYQYNSGHLSELICKECLQTEQLLGKNEENEESKKIGERDRWLSLVSRTAELLRDDELVGVYHRLFLYGGPLGELLEERKARYTDLCWEALSGGE